MIYKYNHYSCVCVYHNRTKIVSSRKVQKLEIFFANVYYFNWKIINKNFISYKNSLFARFRDPRAINFYIHWTHRIFSISLLKILNIPIIRRIFFRFLIWNNVCQYRCPAFQKPVYYNIHMLYYYIVWFGTNSIHSSTILMEPFFSKLLRLNWIFM